MEEIQIWIQIKIQNRLEASPDTLVSEYREGVDALL